MWKVNYRLLRSGITPRQNNCSRGAGKRSIYIYLVRGLSEVYIDHMRSLSTFYNWAVLEIKTNLFIARGGYFSIYGSFPLKCSRSISLHWHSVFFYFFSKLAFARDTMEEPGLLCPLIFRFGTCFQPYPRLVEMPWWCSNAFSVVFYLSMGNSKQ